MIMNNINKLLYTTLVVACLFPLRIYASKLHIDSIGFDNKIYTLFGETNERRTVGSYSIVKGKDLETNSTIHFVNSLSGRLNGLFSLDNTGAAGSASSNNWIRGTSIYGDFIILVDGVERSWDYIEPETIESVELLKDATLKSLYGGNQCNGIIMIKTKRGTIGKNKASINITTGIQQPTRLPKYLDAYHYATMYNQAMINNGYDPYFKDPSAYINGNSVLYPDVDYYDMFLKDSQPILRANMQYTGGNKHTRFFTHLGYQTNGGLEKFTDHPNKDHVFTLRANVDNTVLDFITFSAGFNGALQHRTWPNMSNETFFGMLANNRPNEFPIFIPGDLVGKTQKEQVLGGTMNNRKNPYGYLTQNGYGEQDYTFIQSDFSLKLDFDQWIKGFSIKPIVTFDVYNVITNNQAATFPIYEIIQSEPMEYKIWGKESRATKKTRTGSQTQRNYAFNLTAYYNRTFGKHDINALATFYAQAKEYSTLHEKMKRLNVGGLVNYMYNNKYLAEVSVNHIGVGSFAPGKRFGTFPTFGAGWIITEESFMKDISWLDYLKVKSSYGILGSTTYTPEGLFSAHLYRDIWNVGGAYDVTGISNIAWLSQTGNPDATFQKSYELNIGLEAQLFNRSTRISVGFFDNRLKGALANMSDVTPGVSGKNGALMWQNYKNYKTSGWEMELQFHKQVKDWNINAGFNFCYGKTEVTKELEPAYPEEFNGLKKVRVLGQQLGLKAIGTFTDQMDIDKSPRQTFGTVRPGDIKYADMNGDGIIDNKDRTVIANTTPSLQYGITINLSYKRFNLDILGYGIGCVDRILNNSYYQIYGDRKYSNVVIEGLPNGNPHPILRPEFANNNFVSSDYWVVNGSFFKIRNIELGYTLPEKISSLIKLKSLKIYFRGGNLLTLSKIKDLDPENLDAGITNFPLYRTLTGGVSFTF